MWCNVMCDSHKVTQSCDIEKNIEDSETNNVL